MKRRRALSSSPPAASFKRALRTGNYLGAVYCLEEKQDASPLAVAALCFHVEEYKDAATLLETVEPKTPHVWHLLGAAYHRDGQWRRAQEALVHCCRGNHQRDGQRMFLHACLMAYKEGFTPAYEEAWENIVEQQEDQADILLLAAQLYTRLQRLTRATELVDAALQQLSTAGEHAKVKAACLHQRGIILALQGRVEAAIANFEQSLIVEDHPEAMDNIKHLLPLSVNNYTATYQPPNHTNH